MMPYGAGGLGDVTLRMYAQKFAPRLGQQFIIDSRPGAGGAIAARAALAQPADGYTLFFCGSGMAIYPRGGCEQTTAQQANVLTAVLVSAESRSTIDFDVFAGTRRPNQLAIV